MDDAVDEAVVEQELRPLEARRQLGPDGPRGDAGAGKPDERVGLGQVDIAQDRVRGKIMRNPKRFSLITSGT